MVIALALLLLVFFLNQRAFINYWYWQWWWFDLLMHGLGGLGVGLLVLGCYNQSNKRSQFVLAFSAAFLIGLVWELMEFLANQFGFSWFGFKNFADVDGYLWDTLSDLLAGGVGGLAAGLLVFGSNYLNRQKHGEYQETN